MNKRVSLIVLIKTCFSLTNQAKIDLIKHIEMMTDDQVEKLGQYFAFEREFVLKNQDRIIENASVLLDALEEETAVQPQAAPAL